MSRLPLSSIILGMNARNSRLIKPYNLSEAMKLVKSKIRFKRELKQAKVKMPELIGVVSSFRDLSRIPWDVLEGRNFVIKPDRGAGGAGILVLRWSRRRKLWLRESAEFDRERISRHLRDILDGRYSTKNLPDRAFFEELISPYARFFKQFAIGGLPDVRVIVFNKVPIMAMVRFPTISSDGKANLHAGGIGVGIDIASGVTTNAIHNDQLIAMHPDTSQRLADLKLPNWGRILETAVEAQIASGLGYCGVDLVVDTLGKVLVLEVNARPGLSIQIANLAGLSDRVNRVRNLKVRTAAHGIRIAQELFGEVDLHRIRSKSHPVVKRVQEITLSRINKPGVSVTVTAKMDTGAWNSSISLEIARKLGYSKLLSLIKKYNLLASYSYVEAKKQLGVLRRDPVLASMTDVSLKIANSTNGASIRVMVPVQLRIGRSVINTLASIADRKSMQMTYSVIVGVVDLQGFYVDTMID